MNDRQAGVQKEEALLKLSLFSSGKPDAKYFFEVASQLIEFAYKEPMGYAETEKASITNTFISRVDEKCISGELNPSYNPVVRTAPVIH